MSYREDSGWNDKNELRCLLILRKVQEERFPRGLRMHYCRRMAELPDVILTPGSISAKVGNFMSVAGIGRPSNYSENTRRIYEQYKNYSIQELEEVINRL